MLSDKDARTVLGGSILENSASFSFRLNAFERERISLGRSQNGQGFPFGSVNLYDFRRRDLVEHSAAKALRKRGQAGAWYMSWNCHIKVFNL